MLLYFIRCKRFLGTCITNVKLSINFSISTWTYHVFDKVKVVIMGNSHNILGYGTLDTFLSALGEYVERE